MTPRKVALLLRIGERRRRREMADDLAMYALGSRGDQEALKRQLRRLGGG